MLEQLKRPEEVIAAGLVESRVMDLDEALKELPLLHKSNVVKYVRRPEIVKDVFRDKAATPLPGKTDGPIVVSNEEYLRGAGESKTIKSGFELHLTDVTKSLLGLETFNETEKRSVARELSKPSSTHALYASGVSHPADAVAFAAVRSGVADLSRAVGALPAADARKVKDLLAAAQKVAERTADLKICRSHEGYYIGKTVNGETAKRFSNECWKDQADAENALRTGRFGYRDENELKNERKKGWGRGLGLSM
jgi:hypothetical protein